MKKVPQNLWQKNFLKKSATNLKCMELDNKILWIAIVVDGISASGLRVPVAIRICKCDCLPQQKFAVLR